MPRYHRMMSKTHLTNIGAVERATKALDMRRDNKGFDEIAKALGYADASGAYRAAMAALNRIPCESAQEYRRINLEALKKLLDACKPGIVACDFKAVATALAILAEISKLVGAYPKTEVDVHVIRHEAEALARSTGLDAEELIAEAERIVREGQKRIEQR